jgi:hypothetical protein
MAQQIQQFKRLGKEFAMQHLGSEDEMHQAMRDVLASMPVERRLEGLSAEQLWQALPPEERLKGLSPEERLQGLTPDELELLKQLLQQRANADDNTPGR